MIITLIGQEKNIGILTLTDYLLSKFGRDKCAVVGCNYLVSDFNPILEKINEFVKDKTVIVKYVIPKIKFSNQETSYPDALTNISDLIFKVPSYKEELAPVVPIEVYKGEACPALDYIKEFYK